MSRTPAAHGRVGRPPVTSRAQILAAARRLIDQDGWEKLTIRGLAAEIGIGATTLYHHVRDKDDLLFLLINEYADSIPHPELPADPRDRVIAAATAIHDALAAWPWAAEVLTTDGFISRLGESALWLVETIIAGAVESGCTPEQAVLVFRSVWYYTVGEILIRVRAYYNHQLAGEEVPLNAQAFPDTIDTSRLPHLASLSGQWATLAWQDTYPQGLPVFVDGLLAAYARP
ncbi:TetR/AcrR family transcriptional regulator [Streptomyces sp. NBC_01198]|uniref:TetR/AcrR family transcriptional regulator n=1 Tax=Streptomyces sp. NBC_01198 TaxID=2903769 RepID=UPI002E0F1283|nr:TetR/AcrR family transcriptional regulator [Streptomyces sp. NBC_01198]